MRQRLPLWIIASALLVGAVFCFLESKRLRRERDLNTTLPQPASKTPKLARGPTEPTALLTEPAHVDFTEAFAKAFARQNRSRYPNRLSNTTLPLKQLVASDSAILLQNALLDTLSGGSPSLPGHLQAKGDPGAYIVQAKGPPDDRFRARLRQAGATIVSYIPNNAYLVRVEASAASALQRLPETQSVLKYEPYYKLSPLLLDLAVKQRPLPENGELKVLLFGDAKEGTIAQLQDLGASVLGEESSPFGPVVRVQPPVDALAAVAGLSGVQGVELARKRVSANDLSRFAMGVAADTQVQTNYLGLTGNGVLVNVNDTGIDKDHPDLPNVTGDVATSLADTNGHGTHVAGIIASTGSKSDTVTNAQGSLMPPTNGQFRGKAPAARLYSMDYRKGDGYLQEQAARTNAFISNNSWTYGAAAYDLAAASYDAAVRDALPGQPGSHPVLFVFSAGNLGGAMNDWDDGSNDDGTGGSSDTILSPATAKNVISVGALEQPRGLTNEVWKCVPDPSQTNGQSCQTNKEWMPSTDTADQVASFSSRGNVGIGLEGPYGRFKPDVVAPGSAVVSTRSAQWDQRAYYNPTSHVGPPVLFDLQLQTNELFLDSFFIPANAVAVTIDVVNRSPNVPVPIYVRQAAAPTTNTYDFIRTNHVSIPPDSGLSPVNTGWFYGLGNPTNVPVLCDVFIDITVTNEHGNFLEVLSNMNNTIGPYYRYESGTSLAAAGVSGMLALMQEFFEQRVGVTNSPALMKALVINGARSLGTYNLQAQSSINFQGWGLVNLTNTIQEALMTQPPNPTTAAKYYFDQSTNTAVASGQRRTYTIRVNPESGAQDLPLRITLAWTDPPGNPVASAKLVNDLDLVVTNLDNPLASQRDVFYGNDIQSGNDFNLPWDTNTAPNVDYVNNVENVYLLPPLGTNYSITVWGKRVNVNAVTEHPNSTVQDYALVISSGDGDTNGALTLVSGPSFGVVRTPLVTAITNMFGDTNEEAGQILEQQRAGANTPLLGRTLPLPSYNNGQLSIGSTNQWHFYVFTNTTSFTNVAFVTFDAHTVSVPRMGVREKTFVNSTRAESDIDLYVSLDPALTNLDPFAIGPADKSLGRGGEEAVIYTDSGPGVVYYVGVKSESQEASEYTIFGAASELPFGSTDEEGNFHGRGIPRVAPIPDDDANGAKIIVAAFGAQMPKLVRRVVATNMLSHELMGDLIGTLNHREDFAVLNNHSPDTPVVDQTFVYDDSSSRVAGSRRTDGPGSLLGFRGKGATGVWKLHQVDNAFGHIGTNRNLGLFLEKQQDLEDGMPFSLTSGSCDFAFFTVPPDATNIILHVSITNGTGPLSVQICTFSAPLCAAGCKSQIISKPGGTITLGSDDEPPLNPGTYIVTFCNLGPDLLEGILGPLEIKLGPGINGKQVIATGGPTGIQDDAVTYSTARVNQVGCVRTAEVGVRIDHPRVSDLVLHLVSPDGTRILLSENRGNLSTNGMGYSINITNIIPVSSSGGPEASTNVIDTGQTTGTITISWDFFQIPDQMRVYYQNNRIFDSGLISGAGTTNLAFGPGTSTLVTIVMNEGGNSDSRTAWEYTVTSTSSEYQYFTFTENTNSATTLVKFAPPPFSTSPLVGSSLLSGFENANPGNYTAPGAVENWSVVSNSITVVADALGANTGTKYLALRDGSIRTNLPTLTGHKYQVNFAYRQAPAMEGLVSWWRGDGNAFDSADGNDGTFLGNTTYGVGEVNLGFVMDGNQDAVRVGNPPNLRLQDFSIEAWVRRSSTVRTSFGSFGNGLIFSYGQLGYGLYLDPNGRPALSRIGIDETKPITPILDTNWHHLAVTKLGATVMFYIDGVAYTAPNYNPGFIFTTEAAIGCRIDNMDNSFLGTIDEVGVFNRVLTPAEVQAIYAAGAAGKCGLAVPPAACFGSAQALVNGVSSSSFTGTTNWQTNVVSFTATGTSASLELSAIGNSQMYFDTFTLNDLGGPYYVLPEEPLDKLLGADAFGDWRLEIWDNRVGATNPAPAVIRWQLALTLENTAAAPVALSHHQPVTNSVSPGRILYFTVDVPTWASFATNWLISSTGPVDLLFNQARLPTGTNAGDFTLLANSTAGVNTLATNGSPPLVPGATYVLGVRNTGASPVTFALEVDFDVTPLTNGIAVTSSLVSNSVPRYFSYDVTSNEVAVFFQLTNLTGNADLVIRAGLPFPGPASYDYAGLNPSTSDELILVLANSEPVRLRPGRWYLGVFNVDVTNVSYTIVVTDITNNFPNVVTLTNKSPYTKSAGIGATDYYRYVVTSNAARAQFEIMASTGDVELLVRKGSPATPGAYDYLSGPENDSPLITLLGSSGTLRLQEGEWFLSALNKGGAPATYTIMATEFPVSATNIVIDEQYLITSKTNGGLPGNFCLAWNSVDGLYYYVEAKAALTDANWTTLSGVLTGWDGKMSYCVTLPSPYHFFRVRQRLGAAIPSVAPQLPPTVFITRGTNGISLLWPGQTNETYQVQWSPSLKPVDWQTFTNLVSSTNGTFSFLDDGKQTGGLAKARYYRLVRRN